MLDDNFEMLFEITVRMFLGDRADHIASQAHSATDRKNWYKKLLKVVIRHIQQIDTNVKHKEQLASASETALRLCSQRKFNEAAFSLYLLRLIASLLGLRGVRPCSIASLAYFQSPDQHWTEQILEEQQKSYQLRKDEEQNSIAIRKRLVTQLNSEGLDDYQKRSPRPAPETKPTNNKEIQTCYLEV